MPINVECLPDEPIIIASFVEPIDYREESPWMFQRFVEIRDTDLEGYSRYYTIIDTNGVKVGFSDMVFIMGESRIARQQRREDRPVTLVLVGSGGLMELASKAAGQRQYGSYSMRLFTSLEDALESIRAELDEMPAV